MNVSIENIDKVSALLTVKIEEVDYREAVAESLGEIRRKVEIPGFRKGKVPMSLIQKLYRKSVTADEVNKMLSASIYGYIKEKDLHVLGEPIPNEEKQPAINFDTMTDFEFLFDVALVPEFEIEVTSKDEVNYYTVEVTDEMVENQIKAYTQHNGKYEEVESYEEKDMLKGLIVELDEDGNTKEGGVRAENAVIMPIYMTDEVQKALFDGAKLNDVLVFNPNKAYDGHEVEIASLLQIEKDQVACLKTDFSFQVEEITRFVEGGLDQELFDKVFEKDVVKNEEEFCAKVKEVIAAQFTEKEDFKFLLDAREMLTTKIGKIEFPEAILKRFMLLSNLDKGEEFVNEHYEKSLEELTWQIIKDKLAKEYEIKVKQDDILLMAKEMTRAQFAQYGMMNIPDDILDKYAAEMFGEQKEIDNVINRVVDVKLVEQLKEKVKLIPKTISLDEFTKFFSQS